MRLTGNRIVVAEIVGLALLSANLLIMLFPTPVSSQRPSSVNEYAAHVGNVGTIPAGGLGFGRHPPPLRSKAYCARPQS